MRSYGGNKNYGERGSLPTAYIFQPRLLSVLVIGGFYWSAIIVYALSTATSLADSAGFFYPTPGEHDQKRMRADGVAWKPMSDAIPAATAALTPDTYPLPSDHAGCGNNYLKLNFVCDPDTLLSHTEAIIINRTLGKKFFHCFSHHSPDDLSALFTASPQTRKDDGGEEIDSDFLVASKRENGASREDTRRNDARDYSSHGLAGHRHSAKCIQRRFYTIGIALAKTMQDDGLGQCNGNTGAEKRYNLDSERALRSLLERAKVLPRMARKLRLTNWFNKNEGCSTDILILIVQNVAFCHEGSKAVFFGVEPLTALSFSPRVKRLLAESTASNLEQSRRLWKLDPTITDSRTNEHAHLRHRHAHWRPASANCQNMNCVIDMIRRMMQILDDGLPFLTDVDYRTDELDLSEIERNSPEEEEIATRPSADDSNTPEWFVTPKHTVPTWALIAFAVSLAVTLACAYLGHWVNTGRSRLHATSEAASAAKYLAHNRRWRAGFGGGMLEMHNTQQKGASTSGHTAGGGFGQPARVRGGLQGGIVRAKMFGGLGMAPAGTRSRQSNGPPHSYHRV